MLLVFVELQTDLHSLNFPMGLASFPFCKLSCNMLSNSLPWICKPTASHPSCIHLKTNHKNSIQKPLPIRYQCLSIMAFGAKKSASGEEDKRALETVLKLYTALRNKNITELSEVIGEECRCVCNFISIFQPFHGKKQVLDFFSSLMKYLGNNIEFVVHPTLHDGMNVGVSWRLEWKKTHVPLGKGFGFYMCHIYQGKMTIGNVEMFIEPLLHIEPFRLKLMGFVMTVMDKMGVFKGKVKKAIPYFLLALSLMIALLFFM